MSEWEYPQYTFEDMDKMSYGELYAIREVLRNTLSDQINRTVKIKGEIMYLQKEIQKYLDEIQKEKQATK